MQVGRARARCWQDVRRHDAVAGGGGPAQRRRPYGASSARAVPRPRWPPQQRRAATPIGGYLDRTDFSAGKSRSLYSVP